MTGSRLVPENYAAGLEMRCPGGALFQIWARNPSDGVSAKPAPRFEKIRSHRRHTGAGVMLRPISRDAPSSASPAGEPGKNPDTIR